MKSQFAIRVLGVVVVLATVSLLVLVVLYYQKPWLFTRKLMPIGSPARLLGRALFASLTVSGVGSLIMLLATRNIAWIACMLAFAASMAMIFVLGFAGTPG